MTNRDTVLFEGEVASVTSENDKGIFDILSEHANFISLVKNKLDIEFADGSMRSIPINNGVLKVEENIIEVYLGVHF